MFDRTAKRESVRCADTVRFLRFATDTRACGPLLPTICVVLSDSNFPSPPYSDTLVPDDRRTLGPECSVYT